MKINEQLGMRISYLRKQRGLSQLDLACEANINRNYLCDLEKGKRLSKSIKKYGIDKTIAIFTSSGSGENEKCIEELKSVLPFIKTQVSLVDKSQPDAKDNSKKLERFIKDIQTSIEQMK